MLSTTENCALRIITGSHRNLFDITIASYIGFDRDDGLVIIKDKSAGLVDKTRKKLHKVFEQFGLEITGKVNFQVANFLDGTLDLTTGKHNLYRKPNDDLLHV